MNTSKEDQSHIITPENDHQNLRSLLRDNQRSIHGTICWPDRVLRKILNSYNVAEEIRRLKSENESNESLPQDADWYAKKIFPETYLDENIASGAENALKPGGKHRSFDRPNAYLKIFAILTMCERSKELNDFIGAELSDEDLPLKFEKNCNKPFDCGEVKTGCFESWKVSDAEMFDNFQYRFLVPYLSMPYGETRKVSVPFPETMLLPRQDPFTCLF